VIQRKEGARIGIVTIGGCDPAVREAIELLPQRGVDADFMRICGFPFSEEVEAFLNEHEVNFIVEQNRDAQLRSLLILETGVAKEKLRSILAFGGFPLSAKNVIDGIFEHQDVKLGELTDAIHR
jgi:2-oxoglutarate ferredoxin oxidoreductase subunit alpha